MGVFHNNLENGIILEIELKVLSGTAMVYLATHICVLFGLN